MNLQLQKWQVMSLSFAQVENKKKANKSCQLSVGHTFPDDNLRMFVVGIKVDLSNDAYDLNVEMRYEFTTDEDITEDFMMSSFPRVNAPAIAFPYLRAFISNLTLQAGFEPAILPSVNFVKLAASKK